MSKPSVERLPQAKAHVDAVGDAEAELDVGAVGRKSPSPVEGLTPTNSMAAVCCICPAGSVRAVP